MASTLSSSSNYSSPQVVISVAEKGLSFSPQNVTVAKGDTVKFKLFKSMHIIDESDAPGQCVKSTKITKPLSLIANVPDTTLTYEITRDNGSIYYFDSYAQHCLNGMWGIITIDDANKNNPNSDPTKASTTGTSLSPSEASPSPSETSANNTSGSFNKNNLVVPIILACVVAAGIALELKDDN
ncbi:17451_t:CDS:2 [Entrophospora sp. SA101]|nr:17451_t:CDS:2 [Entrophospora sp. SA101]